MNAQEQFFDRISSLKNLPSLPHILLKLLEASNRENVDFDEIAAIIGKDPALCAKLLTLVNSAYFGLSNKVQDIGQAVVYAGTSSIKAIAICACVYEAFPKPTKKGRFDLKSFWWHSLRCAFLAKHLATKLKFDTSDDAFVSGLLHDIGKIVLWIDLGKAYEDAIDRFKADEQGLIEEEGRLGATHFEVGAWLLKRWKFQAELYDPVCYHHETKERIIQALPMVQIVYIANLLSRDDPDKFDAGAEVAERVFGLSAKQCSDLKESALDEARECAHVMGIGVDAADAEKPASAKKDERVTSELVEETLNLTLLMGTLEGFLAAKDRSDILSVMSDGMGILMACYRPLFFLTEKDQRVLTGYAKRKSGKYERVRNLSVSMRLRKSLPVKAIVEKSPVDSFDSSVQRSLTILDEQIIRLTGGEGIFCHPLIANEETVGVLVLPVQKSNLSQLVQNKKLLALFLHKGALALRLEQLKRKQLQEIQTTRVDATSDLARKVVHEVNNPLSIIKNYLKILEMKWPEEGRTIDEIRIIDEEISRVSELLTKLTDFSKKNTSPLERTDVNCLLTDIVKLTREPLFRHSQTKLEMDLQKLLPMVPAEKAGLKQVFINLIKNAAEAMPSGGTLLIRTRYVAPPIGAGRCGEKGEPHGCVTIQFIDDGPGIADSIKEKLFDPYVSTKKNGHSGLGLSIAYNIVSSFHGNLSCEDAAGGGTVFTVELPLDENNAAAEVR